MKRKAIFTIVACSIAALFFIAVLAVGLREDGFGIGALLAEAKAGPGKDNMGVRYEYTWDPAEHETAGLDVEWINGTVDITVGNGDLIRIAEKSDRVLKDDEKLQLSQSGGTLKIKWNSALISFSIFQNNRKNLTVEVPRAVAESMELLKCSGTSGTVTAADFTAEKLEFSTVSGSISLSGLQGTAADISTVSGSVDVESLELSENLHVSSTSGALSLSGTRAGTAGLSTTSGSISYIGTAGEFSASTVSASVRADLDSCPEKAEMSSVSGGLTLAIPENRGFEVQYDSISGKFKSDFALTGSDGGKSGRGRYSGGDASFDFSTTSGDMQVLKK